MKALRCWLAQRGLAKYDFRRLAVSAPELKKLESQLEMESMTISLDIGCGKNPRNPFNADKVFGIDIRDDAAAGIKKADVVIEPIPFEDNMFDFVTAHDFIEHVPRILYCPERRYPFVELMNEIYRVLKPGGKFLSKTPVFPYSPAWRDPTHVNIITEETFPMYFDDKIRWGAMYGFYGAFKITMQKMEAPHLVSVMEKIPQDQITHVVEC